MDSKKKKVILRKKQKVLAKQVRTTTSIVCGTENPASLGCIFYQLENGELATKFTAREIHEGHDNIMHGGMSGAVLDEVMGRCNFITDENGNTYNPYVTAEMTVKYLKPIPVGSEMRAFGRIDRKEGRKNFNSGEIINAQGDVMATSTGVYVAVSSIRDSNNEDDKAEQLEPLGPEDPVEI